MIVAKILGNIFSDINKKNADLDPFGGKYTPMENYKMKKNLKSMMDKASSNKSDDGPGYRRTAGPTPDQLVAQQVAAERAAKRAAKKRMGKSRRKKYEAAQTMVKKMKLLFTDQGSST